jgi:hypothetical protein
LPIRPSNLILFSSGMVSLSAEPGVYRPASDIILIGNPGTEKRSWQNESASLHARIPCIAVILPPFFAFFPRQRRTTASKIPFQTLLATPNRKNCLLFSPEDRQGPSADRPARRGITCDRLTKWLVSRQSLPQIGVKIQRNDVHGKRYDGEIGACLISDVRPDTIPVTLVSCREIGGGKRFL